MVTYLNNYKESCAHSSSEKKSSSSDRSAEVLMFSKECQKKAKARANLLKAAQKIHW